MQQIKNAVKGLAKGCINKSGVTPEVLAMTKQGEFPPDHALQCYYLCLYAQMKIAKDGRLILDTMNKQIDMMMPTDIIDRSKEVSMKCYNESNELDTDDGCVRAWHYTKCYYETDSSIYFMP